MSTAAQYDPKEFTQSTREAEIDQLVQFIRTRDIRNARRMLVILMGKGERISQEIVSAYERLELE